MDGALPGDFRDNNKDADFIVALEKIPLNTTYVVLCFGFVEVLLLGLVGAHGVQIGSWLQRRESDLQARLLYLWHFSCISRFAA